MGNPRGGSVGGFGCPGGGSGGPGGGFRQSNRHLLLLKGTPQKRNMREYKGNVWICYRKQNNVFL